MRATAGSDAGVASKRLAGTLPNRNQEGKNLRKLSDVLCGCAEESRSSFIETEGDGCSGF